MERELGIAVIAQAYNKTNPKQSDMAPSNKASDLNAAAAWVFASDTDTAPEQIKESIIDLQEAIKEGEISTIYFWYVHNMNEDNNPVVKEEMDTLQLSVQKLVDSIYPNDFFIPARFIICNDPKIIEKIINNNNKQNEILPSDLRSNDKQQERLRRDFNKYPALFYSGGRRDDKVVRNKEVFDPYLVAQTLKAYHGDCVLAYNGKKILWDDDKEYNNVFIDQLTVEHIIYVYSLSRAIDEYKIRLKTKGETRTDSEEQQMMFLSKRGSKMLLIYAISETMENIVGSKINDSWQLRFKDCSDFDKLVKQWYDVIEVVLAFSGNLLPALEGGLKNKETAKKTVESVKAIIVAIQVTLKKQLKEFISMLKWK